MNSKPELKKSQQSRMEKKGFIKLSYDIPHRVQSDITVQCN